MHILILGADGYLGRVLWRYLEERGHSAVGIDSGVKLMTASASDTQPLYLLPQKAQQMDLRSITPDFIESFDAIVHFAELPSAPYSMSSAATGWHVIENNVHGTYALVNALRHTDIPLIKLGTMGEYGTPNIDIEEGWLNITHNGRQDRLLYPKTPGSLYHLSKVYDSDLLAFACRMWGLRVTDLNQGFVYGFDQDTYFWYDGIWGTALNRFITQAVAGVPLTVYGRGGQTRGIINIVDTMQCIELAINNPPNKGEFRVMNQFTEQARINDLALQVKNVAAALGIRSEIGHITNPRKELDEHYYNAIHTKLPSMGLRPTLLTDDILAGMIEQVSRYKSDIRIEQILPEITWT